MRRRKSFERKEYERKERKERKSSIKKKSFSFDLDCQYIDLFFSIYLELSFRFTSSCPSDSERCEHNFPIIWTSNSSPAQAENHISTTPAHTLEQTTIDYYFVLLLKTYCSHTHQQHILVSHTGTSSTLFSSLTIYYMNYLGNKISCLLPEGERIRLSDWCYALVLDWIRLDYHLTDCLWTPNSGDNLANL